MLCQPAAPPSAFNRDYVCLDFAVDGTPPEALGDSLSRDVGRFS